MSRVDDLRQARSRMETVRGEIYAAVDGRTETELMAPPPDGGWAAVEVLDHIRTAESTLVRALAKFEKGEPTRVPRVAWLYRLPMAPAFWNVKIRAPKLVRPKPRAELKPAQVLEGLHTSRRDLFAYADRVGEEAFAALVFPHFILGRFTGVSWFQFIGKHECRHLAQLRRVLALPKVMRCGPAR